MSCHAIFFCWCVPIHTQYRTKHLTSESAGQKVSKPGQLCLCFSSGCGSARRCVVVSSQRVKPHATHENTTNTSGICTSTSSSTSTSSTSSGKDNSTSTSRSHRRPSNKEQQRQQQDANRISSELFWTETIEQAICMRGRYGNLE